MSVKLFRSLGEKSTHLHIRRDSVELLEFVSNTDLLKLLVIFIA